MLAFVRAGPPLMPEIIADPPSPCCSPLFFGPGTEEYQSLVPDPFCLARAMRAGASPREAPATRAAGRTAGRVTQAKAGRDDLSSNGRPDFRRCEESGAGFSRARRSPAAVV